jgi:hypothetical protein
MNQKRTSESEGFQGDTPHTEALDAQLKTINQMIKSGERKRRANSQANLNASQDPNASNSLMMDIGLGLIKTLKFVFWTAPTFLLKGVASVGGGVIRKLTDKLAGTDWEERAKAAKEDLAALNELNTDNEEVFSQGIKERQEKMGQLHREQQQIEDELKQQAEKLKRQGETLYSHKQDEEVESPINEQTNQKEPAAITSGVPDAPLGATTTNVTPLSTLTRLVNAIEQVEESYPAASLIDVASMIQGDCLDALVSGDYEALSGVVHQLLYSHDDSEELADFPALRNGVSLFFALHLTERMLADAQQDGPSLEELSQDIEQHGLHDSMFMTMLAKRMDALGDVRSRLIRQVSAAPVHSNDPASMYWLSEAFAHYQQKAAEATNSSAMSRDRTSPLSAISFHPVEAPSSLEESNCDPREAGEPSVIPQTLEHTDSKVSDLAAKQNSNPKTIEGNQPDKDVDGDLSVGQPSPST